MKNKFLKIISFMCILVITFGVAGCGCDGCGCNNSSDIGFNQYWFDDAAAASGNVTETAVYDIVFRSDYASGPATNKYLAFQTPMGEDGKAQNIGTFTATFRSNTPRTELEKDAGEDYQKVLGAYEGSVYSYTTRLEVKGSYKVGSENPTIENVDDVMVSKVYFKNLSGELFPMFSAQEISTTSAVNQIAVAKFVYTTKTVYADKKAVTTLSSEDEETLKYFRKNSIMKEEETSVTRTVKKANASYDNIQLLFLIRGLRLSKKFSATIPVIDTVTSSKKNISVKSSSEAEKITSNIPDITAETENAGTEITCYKAEIALNASTYSGAKQTAFYAAYQLDSDTEGKEYYKTYHNVMVRYYEPLPYNTGTLQYTLSSYTRT